MSRVSEREYNAIVEVKSAIAEFLESREKFLALENWATEGGYNLYEVASFAVRKLSHSNVLAAMALRTIIESGTFHNIEVAPGLWGDFSMPATACCCENFAACKKSFNKKEPLQLYCTTPIEEGGDLVEHYVLWDRPERLK